MRVLGTAWLGSQLLLASICAAQVKTSTAFIEDGKRKLDNGQFVAAADALREAAELDPHSAVAYELLARALAGQASYNLRLLPDVNGVLPKAEAAAKKAVELAPLAASGWCALGLVDHKRADAARDVQTRVAELNAADKAFKKALSINAESFEAHYELGKMALDTAMEPLLAARYRSGVPFGKPGRIQDPEILKSMQERYGVQVRDGIEQMQHALTINPNSWNAMHQMAGLLNERSLIEDTDEKANADRDLAAEWEKKSQAAKPIAPAKPVSSEQAAKTTAFLDLTRGEASS